MKVYLGETLLPVAPEKITRNIKNQNVSKKLINGEEINIPLPSGLMEITLSGVLFPVSASDFVAPVDLKTADDYIGELYELKRKHKVFEFKVNESSDGLCADGSAMAMNVTLETYNITNDAAEGNNIEVQITLKEYREYGLEVIPTKKDTVLAKTSIRTTKEKTDTTTYTVKSGDTLWAIAKKFYGDGSRYPYLANLNNIANPNIIHTGQVLTIGPAADAKAYVPAKSKSTSSTTSTSASSSSTTKTDTTSAAKQAEIAKAQDVRRLAFLYKSDEDMLSTEPITIKPSTSANKTVVASTTVNNNNSRFTSSGGVHGGTSGSFASTSTAKKTSSGLYKSEGGLHSGSSGSF